MELIYVFIGLGILALSIGIWDYLISKEHQQIIVSERIIIGKKIFMFFLVFLVLSCQSKKNEKTLINDFSFDIPLVNDIDDLFGQKARVIQLDTITEALVGRIYKLIKHENHFYILSDERRILHFDNDGKFISSLEKKGGGPGEYTRIDDFNLITKNGNIELWICDNKRICKYVRSGNSWDFAGTIDFDFEIHKFKFISDEHILFLTGQDESLLLTDITGTQIRTYLKREIIPLIHYPVQFVYYDSCIIYKLGVSNECISIDTKDYSFERIKIVDNERFLSSKDVLDMIDKFGYSYVLELHNTIYIAGFRNINGTVMLFYYYHGVEYAAVRQQGVWKRIKNDREKKIGLSRLIIFDSFDSFITYEYPEDDALNLILYEYIQ